MYQKVDDVIIEKLIDIVGEKNILINSDDKEPYSHDETTGLKSMPEIVVKVENATEISNILSLANEMKVPVTPRGAGTGVSGGSVPIHGGILLSLEKMNKILEIDMDNLMAVVEPGVITGDIHREAEKRGLFYPPDPASIDTCSIGGNVAECAGGPRAVKYGVTKDYICGLEAVIPTGEIIHCGGKLVKNVTGYDLIGLLTGSEGTLAIITKIILKLLPLPKIRVNLLVPFDDLAAASKTVFEIIQHKIIPTVIEFMDKESIQACEKLLERKLPFSQAGAHLFIELDGDRKEYVQEDYEILGEICLKNGALDVLVADNKPTQDKLWESRRIVPEALKAISSIIGKADVVIPRAEIPPFIKSIGGISKKYNISIACFGHVGDGNVHVNILKKELTDEEWQEISPQVFTEVMKKAVSLGGMISGEHGIGIAKKEYLPLALQETEIDLMKKIKGVFDPNNILNPGKIF